MNSCCGCYSQLHDYVREDQLLDLNREYKEMIRARGVFHKANATKSSGSILPIMLQLFNAIINFVHCV